MVIEEPPPPEPVVITVLPETPAPKEAAPPRHRATHREQTPAAPESGPETDEEPAPPVPSLEPRESSTEQAALRREIQGLQDDVQKRISKLSAAELSGVDRKTLEDAKAFFAQSTQALNEADLLRALMLARKASLLVSALEK
jgi:outer membrane biosynthesis protein TonB